MRSTSPAHGPYAAAEKNRRPWMISMFFWLLRIPVPVLVLLYLFGII
jgi:hypothetical protein